MELRETTACARAGSPSLSPNLETGLGVRFRRLDGMTCLAVAGEIDVATIGLFEAALAGARHLAGDLQIDLSGVSFAGVVAGRVISVASLWYRRQGRQLLVVGIRPPVRKMFVAAGWADAVDHSGRRMNGTPT